MLLDSGNYPDFAHLCPPVREVDVVNGGLEKGFESRLVPVPLLRFARVRSCGLDPYGGAADWSLMRSTSSFLMLPTNRMAPLRGRMRARSGLVIMRRSRRSSIFRSKNEYVPKPKTWHHHLTKTELKAVREHRGGAADEAVLEIQNDRGFTIQQLRQRQDQPTNELIVLLPRRRFSPSRDVY